MLNTMTSLEWILNMNEWTNGHPVEKKKKKKIYTIGSGRDW